MDDLREQVVALGCLEQTMEAPSRPGTASRPRHRSKPDDAERWLGQLARTIEGEIIPRLMLAHREEPAGSSSRLPERDLPGRDEVAELTQLVLAYEAGIGLSFAESLRAEGVPLETIFLDLLAPTARRLGDLWVQDLCDFTQVTVGLSRLQQVLCELSAHSRSQMTGPCESRHRILLLPLPGEQHTFGLSVVAEFFRHAGWDVQGGCTLNRDELIARVRNDWYEVVGLSLSGERRLDELGALIRTLRRKSRNRAVGIMVGGPVFNAHPDYVARVGADATAVDGRQAVLQAESLLNLLVGC